MSGSNAPSILRWKGWFGYLPPFPGEIRLIDVAAAVLRFIGENEQRVCLWEGAEFCVDLRDRIQRQMWCGCYEPHVMAALRRILRPGDTFIDLGAHIGYHSYFAAGLVGASGRVFSFEADRTNFQRLRKNLEHFAQATAEHCAVWSGEEKLVFTRSESRKESGWGALAAVRNAPQREHAEVHGVSLDAWSERAKPEAIRAIKIDVEGAELAVLRGANGVLQGMRPILVLEINEPLLRQAGASALMIEELLRGQRYNLNVLSNGPLLPWRAVGEDESVDCVAVPKESGVEKATQRWGSGVSRARVEWGKSTSDKEEDE
jgi:FkbM family methyltransferase